MRQLPCKQKNSAGQTFHFIGRYWHLRRRGGEIVFLSVLTVVFCYLFCFQYGIFGSKVDWISQHSVLPDYFRQQFYETGELFPEFALNIGGGQNVYNFAYYGLYNPVILMSYLLPFVKMSDYMMAAQFVSLLAAVILMYRWLGKRRFPKNICIGAAMVFLLSGPMIFHSYNQIMFVNYMPFLIMGLMGVDRYFGNLTDDREKNDAFFWRKRSFMLSVSIFLMIMTSFYFSIGGMLVLALYGIHRYLMAMDEKGEKISFKGFLTEGVRFSIPFIVAVMMSGVLLIPTAFALTGREEKSLVLGFRKLLFPEISVVRFCYSPYGIGMTTLALTALIAIIFGRKWHERILGLSCMAVLTIPIFAYLLNGGLYVRDKVMIPFLPLLCYILAYYLESLESPKENAAIDNRLIRVLPYILTIVLIYVGRRQSDIVKYWKLLILDGFVMLLCFCIHCWMGIQCRMKSCMLILVPAIMMLIMFDYTCHDQADRAVGRRFYKEVTDSDIGELIAKTTEKEAGFYRTEQLGSDVENAANLNRIWSMDQYSSSVYSSSYHRGYRKFREETFGLEEPFRNFLMQSAVHNPVYQRFMGVKYVVSKEEIPGYEAVESQGRWTLYRNEQVAPIAYATDKVITEEEYRKLEYPYNQLALLQYAVVEHNVAEDAAVQASDKEVMDKDTVDKEVIDGEENSFVNRMTSVKLNLPEMINTDSDEAVSIELPVLQEDRAGEKVLFLQFQVKNLNPSKDVAVWVDGIRNKLTSENHFYYNANTEFSYTVPLEDNQKSVEIIFGKGEYEITDVEAFTGVLLNDGEDAEKERLYQSEFQMDQKKTKGNCIAGTIEVEKQGYFVTTIPYDDNFEILTDGRRVEGEEINTAFLGFKIEAGKHDIEIIYHAPGVETGKIMSVVGILVFLMYLVRGRKSV